MGHVTTCTLYIIDWRNKKKNQTSATGLIQTKRSKLPQTFEQHVG
jgi:hypothetical protein